MIESQIRYVARRCGWTQGGCTSWHLDAKGYEFTPVHAPRPTSAA